MLIVEHNATSRLTACNNLHISARLPANALLKRTTAPKKRLKKRKPVNLSVPHSSQYLPQRNSRGRLAMKKSSIRQFFRAYFHATRNSGGWLMRGFTAAQRDDMLDSVMQWRYTQPVFKKAKRVKQ
jgi:hypothetical protein